MSPFGLKFSQMILHTETSKLMYNWSYLFVVLHKPTLLPSTFNITWETLYLESLMNLDNILTTLEVENKTKMPTWPRYFIQIQVQPKSKVSQYGFTNKPEIMKNKIKWKHTISNR